MINLLLRHIWYLVVYETVCASDFVFICHDTELYIIVSFCCFQFLFGSVHVLKQPLFRRACELVFSEYVSGENDYISEQEVCRLHWFFLLVFLFKSTHLCYDELTCNLWFLIASESVWRVRQACNPGFEWGWGDGDTLLGFYPNS